MEGSNGTAVSWTARRRLVEMWKAQLGSEACNLDGSADLYISIPTEIGTRVRAGLRANERVVGTLPLADASPSQLRLKAVGSKLLPSHLSCNSLIAPIANRHFLHRNPLRAVHTTSHFLIDS